MYVFILGTLASPSHIEWNQFCVLPIDTAHMMPLNCLCPLPKEFGFHACFVPNNVKILIDSNSCAV
jgi:hypothetical protein